VLRHPAHGGEVDDVLVLTVDATEAVRTLLPVAAEGARFCSGGAATPFL
jgi:hypothetical protein